MPAHEFKYCPRCRREFECKSDSVLICQCQAVTLSPEQLEYIAALYHDCLCASCLRELRSEYSWHEHYLGTA